MSEHTNGPLKFLEQGEACEYCLVTDDKRWVISFRLNGEFMPLAQQDIARRMVACWNACEGLDTELLENIAMTGGLVERFALINQTEQQRDDLLAAAKNLRDVKGRHHSEQAFNELVETIAKVEAA